MKIELTIKFAENYNRDLALYFILQTFLRDSEQ